MQRYDCANTLTAFTFFIVWVRINSEWIWFLDNAKFSTSDAKNAACEHLGSHVNEPDRKLKIRRIKKVSWYIMAIRPVEGSAFHFFLFPSSVMSFCVRSGEPYNLQK